MADDLEAAVSRWAADQGLREGARARAAARHLADAATGHADLGAVLRDLAAGARPVRLGVTGGRGHRGVLEVVGEDYLGLATLQGWGLIALRALAAVVPDAGLHRDDPAAASGWVRGPDWSDFPPARLADAVERLAGRDLPVRVRTHDEETGTTGELAGSGADFLRLATGADRPDAGPRSRGPGTVYVPLASVAELWVLFRSG